MNRDDSKQLRVQSSLPRAWEVERTFNDSLYEWMERAPWLAISATAHGVVILVMLAIPWDLLESPKSVVILAHVDPPIEVPFVDPPQPEILEPLETVSPLDPAELPIETPPNTIDTSFEDTDPAGEVEGTSDAAFTGKDQGDVIGIGPGSSGKLGTRGIGVGGSKPSGGADSEVSLGQGLEWLKAHQSADGSWDCDGFQSNCGRIQAGKTCDGPGEATHDVGMSGLALLAFLGDGSTTREGPYREQVAKAIKWLKDQQDADSGVFGERVGHGFMYDHSIATLAMCEAFYFSRSPLLRRSAQDAINFISRARNPYGAWRYNVPPDGQSDTSVSGWCVFAMASAQEGGLTVDPEGFVGAANWIDEVTDPVTGRTGYDSIGSASSRVTGLNDQYPTDRGEAMTAVAILSRVFIGQDVESNPIVEKGAELLKKRLPEWDPDGLGNDLYYWYYGSYALFQLGGPRWEAWNKSAKKALIDNQRRDGDLKGSWDPRDAWGHAGGRVYTTALAALCLEVYFRYARVIRGR